MKIPPQAKKVFSGIIFDVYQWEQELFDGSKATFEMLKRPDTVQVIATHGDKILIGYERQPTKGPAHTLLGGRVDKGEEPLAAAKRELLEEAGLASDDWELLGSVQPLNKLDWTVYTFIARECKKNAAPKLEAGEDIQVREVDFDEFIDIVTGKNFWGQELACEVLRMKMEGRLEELRKRVFGNEK